MQVVSLPPDAPLSEAVALLATPRGHASFALSPTRGRLPVVRAVFVLDPASQAPLGVVTPTDVLRIVSELGGVTGSQAAAAAAAEV